VSGPRASSRSAERTLASGYACAVTVRLPRGQCALAFLLVLAVLFAPGREERASPVRLADDTVGARILAPTGRDGITSTTPKLSARHLLRPDERSLPGSIPVILVSVAAALLLASLVWLARQDSRAVLRLVALRTRVPRAPPGLLAA
jgi:hypothetical protein